MGAAPSMGGLAVRVKLGSNRWMHVAAQYGPLLKGGRTRRCKMGRHKTHAPLQTHRQV